MEKYATMEKRKCQREGKLKSYSQECSLRAHGTRTKSCRSQGKKPKETLGKRVPACRHLCKGRGAGTDLEHLGTADRAVELEQRHQRGDEVSKACLWGGGAYRSSWVNCKNCGFQAQSDGKLSQGDVRAEVEFD